MTEISKKEMANCIDGTLGKIQKERKTLSDFHQVLREDIVKTSVVEKRGFFVGRREESISTFNPNILDRLTYMIDWLEKEHVKIRQALDSITEYVRNNNAYIVGEYIINQRMAGIISRHISRFQSHDALEVKKICTFLHLDLVQVFNEKTNLNSYRAQLESLQSKYSGISIAILAEEKKDIDPIKGAIEWGYMMDELTKLTSFVNSLSDAFFLQRTIEYLRAQSRNYTEWSQRQPNYLRLVESLKMSIETEVREIQPEAVLDQDSKFRLLRIQQNLREDTLPKLEAIALRDS